MIIIRFLGNILRNTYLQRRWYMLALAICLVFIAAFVFPPLMYAGYASLAIFIAATFFEIFSLYMFGQPAEGNREMAKVLSLGDENKIFIHLNSHYPLKTRTEIYEELPEQLQIRDFCIKTSLQKDQKTRLEYNILPKERGLYIFGDTVLMFFGILGLTSRRFVLPTAVNMKVYPSIIQMKKFELRNLQKTAVQFGLKRKRKIGQSYEFEQINNYVTGDDFRHINWKATGKTGGLMVNNYVEEKSQQVYCILDKSRNMLMPFKGLSLLDYAINTSLVLSNTGLGKSDKAGLISFSQKIETHLKASHRKNQLSFILDALYNETTNDKESNYEILYHFMRQNIGQRSLIFLFTNFESRYNMVRKLDVLRKIARHHLLVVVFFENTEISEYSTQTAANVREIYERTIAKKFTIEKFKITQELQQQGIMSIYTRPENLTINSINKYLEIKSRGLI